MDLISREVVKKRILDLLIPQDVDEIPSAFEGMTNREVIKALFPNVVEYDRDEHHSTLAIRGEGKDIVLPISFLDSPYKEVSE